MQLLQGPLDVLIGTAYGLILGFICWILPHQDNSYVPFFRFLLLFTAGLVSLFGSAIVSAVHFLLLD